MTGLHEEPPHGVRDRDQPPRSAREGPVDVPERPEQVAIVVVARRDERHAEDARRDRAVDVRVHEMGVQQIRLLRPHGPHDVARHPRAEVRAAADVRRGHAELVEPRVELRRRPGHVEAEEARVDARRPQRGQQREEVVLGAADAAELVDVKNPQRARRERYRASTSSAMRSVAKRTRTSSPPWRPSIARSSGSRASDASRPASPSTSPIGTR